MPKPTNTQPARLKSLGIPGIPPSINTLLNGSIYATMVDSVPAHLSITIQALKTNLTENNTCVLITPMTPSLFLSRAKACGIDFSDEIAQSRLYFFTQEGDYATNIFRHGIKRFLHEFDYFKVPRESFFLFDQAGDLFTMSDQIMAQTQAQDYQDWMRASGNTALFIFPSKDDRRSQSLLSCFSGVARVNQSKTGLELLIDFWYSVEGAVAAKAFPVFLDRTGLIRVDTTLSEVSVKASFENISANDQNTVFYYGPDFDTFSAAIKHSEEWQRAQTLVDLVHLVHDAVMATVVISLDGNVELKQVAKIVHYMRLNRGNKLKIVIREVGFSLRYLNELLLLRLGANLIIHQQIAKQQFPLLWELLAGQKYTRNIDKDFDFAYASILPSDYKGYVDLVTFCDESLGMLSWGDAFDIHHTLVVASYPEQANIPEILGKINIIRDGDIFSSDETHCYVIMHACSEDNSASAFSRITKASEASLFASITYLTKQESILKVLLDLVQSGNIALLPDLTEPIALLRSRRSDELASADETPSDEVIAPQPMEVEETKFMEVEEAKSVEVEDTIFSEVETSPPTPEIPPEIQPEPEPSELANLMNRLATQPHPRPPILKASHGL